MKELDLVELTITYPEGKPDTMHVTWRSEAHQHIQDYVSSNGYALTEKRIEINYSIFKGIHTKPKHDER